jgi:hypothetical protein
VKHILPKGEHYTGSQPSLRASEFDFLPQAAAKGNHHQQADDRFGGLTIAGCSAIVPAPRTFSGSAFLQAVCPLSRNSALNYFPGG